MTAPGARPIRKKGALTPQQPKPCPTCYAPMKLVATRQGVKRYACTRHGEPHKP